MQIKLEIASRWRWYSRDKAGGEYVYAMKPKYSKGMFPELGWIQSDNRWIDITGLTTIKATGLWQRRTQMHWEKVA